MSAARTLVAALRVYDRNGRATMREVAAEAGHGLSVVHGHIHRTLLPSGLLVLDEGTQATLRPGCALVVGVPGVSDLAGGGSSSPADADPTRPAGPTQEWSQTPVSDQTRKGAGK